MATIMTNASSSNSQTAASSGKVNRHVTALADERIERTERSISRYDQASFWLAEKIPLFFAKLSRHLKKQLIAYVLLLCLSALFLKHYTIGVNATFSLPHSLFIVEKNAAVGKGDYAAFRWHGGGPYAAGKSFIKQLAGGAGDAVTQRERQFFINGQPFGLAKTYSKAGLPLEMGPTGVIPAGKFYVATPHPDSLDSRYALTGWIDRDQILGKVIWKW
jgi:conjugal transfer pilin signal peptidase TrbI